MNINNLRLSVRVKEKPGFFLTQKIKKNRISRLKKDNARNQQVLANKDASPFLHCFVEVVAVVMVIIVIMIVVAVVVVVVWMHMNHHLSLLFIFYL